MILLKYFVNASSNDTVQGSTNKTKMTMLMIDLKIETKVLMLNDVCIDFCVVTIILNNSSTIC